MFLPCSNPSERRNFQQYVKPSRETFCCETANDELAPLSIASLLEGNIISQNHRK